MFRTDLPPDRGMWFPFDPPQPASFWMFNTLINLDIIFLHQGKVVYIAADVPGCPAQPCPTYGPPPSQLVDGVLEFRGGTAAALGLQAGFSARSAAPVCSAARSPLISPSLGDKEDGLEDDLLKNFCDDF
jgi:uncharacterized membrane protein (UPF0127 family)